MNRQEWLQWRRLGLGGSDVGRIRAGHGWSIFLSKTRGIDDDLESDEAVQTGRRLEKVIGVWAAEQTESRLVFGVPWVGPATWLRGTPDFFLDSPMIGPQDRGRIGLECKVSEWPWKEIPPPYLDQVRWYMAVTRTDRWVIAAFHRCAPAWRLYHIERDAEAERELVQEMRTWWHKHVVMNVPPAIDGSTACSRGLTVLRNLPEDRGGLKGALRTATTDELALVLEYIDTDEVVKRLEGERNHLRNRVRGAVGDSPGLRWTGGRIKVGRTGRVTHRMDS